MPPEYSRTALFDASAVSTVAVGTVVFNFCFMFYYFECCCCRRKCWCLGCCCIGPFVVTYILLFSFVAFSFVTAGSVGDGHGEYVMHVLLLRCCQCWYGTNRVDVVTVCAVAASMLLFSSAVRLRYGNLWECCCLECCFCGCYSFGCSFLWML